MPVAISLSVPLLIRFQSDRPVSVERETFPELLAADRMVIGVVDDGYWLDLGTPLHSKVRLI
jgi:NDP-sugar pyrophosphorylase family protein